MLLFIVKPKTALIFLVLCSILVIVSVVLIVSVFPMIITSKLKESLELREHTEPYDRYLDVPVPLTYKVYIFNIENPDAIINGAKPIIKERGPYVYKEHITRTVNSTNDEEDTLSFYQTNRFVFDAEASGRLSDEDVVTTVNVPLMSILETLQDIEKHILLPLVSKCLNSIFPNFNTLFIKVKVKDLIINGINFCPNNLSMCEPVTYAACKILGSKRTIYKRPDGTLQFAFLNYKIHNNILVTLKKGVSDLRTLGKVVRINNSTFTDIWAPNSTCDEVRGGDITLFSPPITKQAILDLYSVDICRTAQLKFFEETVYKNINALMFILDENVLRDDSPNKGENCFCSKATRWINDEQTCYLDGVLDFQPCIGAPVLLSLPHFLWADKHYRQSVEGMFPNESLHRTFVTLEPNTGIPLEERLRVQINAVLRPINIKGLKKLSRTILPLMWFEEGMSLDDEHVEQLNDEYFKMVLIVDIVKWIFLGLSTLGTVVFASYYLHLRYVNRRLVLNT